MTEPRILIACPIKDRQWAVPHWYAGIERNLDIGAEIDIVALLSPSEDGTEGVLRSHNVEVIHDLEEGRPVHEIDSHMWGVIAKFEYMARLRNILVKNAIAGDYDYFFSLDSDIVLPDNALVRLLDYAQTHPGVISPSVNMAQGRGGVIWNVMNWSMPQMPHMANRDRLPKAGQADVIMAAMLLDRKGMECRWEAHMAGEDVGFCLDAEDRGVPRWWYPDVRCQHLMNRC